MPIQKKSKNRLFSVFYLLFFIFSSSNSLASVDSPARMLIAEDRWERILTKDGIDVFSQKVENSDILAFKATGTLNAPVDQIMEVLRKVEISRDWMPDTAVKYTVKEISDLEAVTYSVNKLPWPFSGRELLLHNKLRLDRQNKYLVVDVFSVEDASRPVEEGNVRAFMHIGQTCIRPVGPHQTRILFTFFLDPKGYIPAWLANLKQKELPYNFLRSLEETAGKTRFPLRPLFQTYLNQLNILLLENDATGSGAFFQKEAERKEMRFGNTQ